MSTPTIRRSKPSRIFYVHWSYKDRDTGKWRSCRKSMDTENELEAQKKLALFIDNEFHLPPGDPKVTAAAAKTRTIAELWEAYTVGHVEKKSAAPASITFAWKNLEKAFGRSLVGAVTQAAVEAYERDRAAGKIGRPSNAATVRKELAMLRACLNWCAHPKRKLLDPADLPLFDLPAESEPRDRWLRIPEMQRLLDAAARMRRGPRLSRGERFLWIALEAPARMSAILELTWDRVDFDTNTIHFDVPGRLKTKKRRANVAMSKPLRQIMERAHAERVNELVMDNGAAIWATIQWIAIEAGFSDQEVERGQKPKATGISPHTLRHTAATHMARRGVPLFAIAKVLGNSVAMVEKVYAKWSPDNPEGTVDMISGGVLAPAE